MNPWTCTNSIGAGVLYGVTDWSWWGVLPFALAVAFVHGASIEWDRRHRGRR